MARAARPDGCGRRAGMGGFGMGDRLERRLGLSDAVVIGLGAMLGAGVFAAVGPAAGAAGSWLLVGLGLAGLVAYANASSSAGPAAGYPGSGGACGSR